MQKYKQKSIWPLFLVFVLLVSNVMPALAASDIPVQTEIETETAAEAITEAMSELETQTEEAEKQTETSAVQPEEIGQTEPITESDAADTKRSGDSDSVKQSEAGQDKDEKKRLKRSLSEHAGNMAELQEAVDTVSEGGVVTLDPSFTWSAVTISINHDRNFTITGGSQTLTSANAKHFKFSKATAVSSSTITIKELTLDGNNGGGGIETAGKISLVFDKVTFKQIANGVLSAGTDRNITVKNSSFLDCAGGVNPGAIYSTQNAIVNVENCTFRNVSCTAGGYSGGAIRVHGGARDGRLTIKNSVFKGCEGARNGGAISIYLSNTTLEVDSCYFEGNRVTQNISNADGGAISVFSVGYSNDVSIKNSTFYRNFANDDAGAVFLENFGDGAANYLENNTFVENYSYDYNPTTSSGGAIQISLKTAAILKSNTFYKNMTTAKASGGGALGRHIALSGLNASYSLEDNIFIGNLICSDLVSPDDYTAIEHNSSNINSMVSTNIGNIGVDRGTALAENVTVKNVFGSDTPGFGVYGQGRLAGNPSDSTQITIPVMQPILPNNGSTALGLADGSGSGATTQDQRGYTRGTPADSGAVDVLYVEFNANGGSWSGTADEFFYDTSLYYRNDDQGKTDEQLKVVNYAGTATVPAAEPEPPAAGKVFKGWHTSATAEVPLGAAELNAVISGVTSNQKLYAVWADPVPTYTVTYHGNGNDSGTAPSDSNVYPSGTIVTTQAKGDLIKAHHTFGGWNTAADGSGTHYDAGGTFTITADTDLYAEWIEDPKYTVTYDGNGHTEGTPPVDGSSPYYSGSTVKVLGQNNLVKEGYLFKGWNTTSQANGINYSENATFVITEDVTLYAEWIKDPTYGNLDETEGDSSSESEDNSSTKTKTDTKKKTDTTNKNSTTKQTVRYQAKSSTVTKAAKTGDETPIFLYLMVAVISLGAIGTVFYQLRKKRNS